MSLVKEVEICGRTIKFEFNKFAKQANGSVMVSCGDTQVLVTVCGTAKGRPGQSFFPLTVDYIEKFYAAGRIPGGFFKREAKPSERESLTSRVIDRPLRPSFPEEFMGDTQIMATVMSIDAEVHPASLALVGASTALMISDIPFNGPVAALRVGIKDGDYFLDPPEVDPGELELNVACRPDAVLMVEAGANFFSESQMLDAINWAHEKMQPLFKMQEEVAKEIGKPKFELETKELSSDIEQRVKDFATDKVKSAFAIDEKMARYKMLDQIKDEMVAELNTDEDNDISEELKEHLSNLKYNLMRGQILNDKRRLGGRGYADIRQLTCETGVLAKPHGSSLFTRGETQAIATVTLGAGEDEQRLDTILTPDASKSFMLHYNFPPYSVGEARFLRTLSRREMGHGALAERSLSRVIPDKNAFGYTIRVVSEVLESNGSSSMATVCSGTMAMLAAGVPIKQPVAGIAMGLIKEGDNYAILSDILGDEDHLGDMDFKVCGGAEGISALQMDIKIGGLSKEILAEALDQAKAGRQHILKAMTDCIAEPNELSDNAPRIFNIKIKPDKIKDIIGPGGKMIKKIVAETGVKIDIDDGGMVNIVSPDVPAAEAAKKIIRAITSDPEVGGIYLGKVKKIMDFGAFIEVSPGSEGLCHISELDHGRVGKVTDVLSEGEEVMVKVLDIDRSGKIKLSRKEAFDKKPTH